MKDKIRDFKDLHGETVSSILKIIVSIVSIFVIFGLLFGWFSKNEDPVGELKENVDYTSMYTVLNEYELGKPGKPAVNKDILLTDPFTEEEDLIAIVEFIVSNDKAKYKDELYAEKIRIFTRELVYNEGLEAPWEVTYQHKDGWEEGFEKKIKNYKNHEFINLPQVYPYTDEFKANYMDDKEYTEYLKIMKYFNAVGNLEPAIKIYLKHDLKMVVDSDAYIKKLYDLEGETFQNIQSGEPSNMYGESNDFLLDYLEETDPKLYDIITQGDY